MKKTLLFLLTLCFLTLLSFGQVYKTSSGIINFDAGTGMEDIKGINKGVSSAFDSKTGRYQFLLPINGFEFKSQLMQDHFHENYMETDKYPKSKFTGQIIDINTVNFSKNGTYPVKVKGILEMHGVSKEVTANGNFIIDHGAVQSYSEFYILLSDFGISVPSLVGDKLSKKVKIQVNCQYSIYNKQ